MNLAEILAARWVYLVDVLPGVVLRARAVATGDLLRAGIASRLVMVNPVPVEEAGAFNLQPPPQTAASVADDLAAYERIRFAALAVDGSWAKPEGFVALPAWPSAEVVWEPFRLVATEAEEDIAAGRLWLDRVGGAVVVIGNAVLRESAGAQGVARSLTSFPRG